MLIALRSSISAALLLSAGLLLSACSESGPGNSAQKAAPNPATPAPAAPAPAQASAPAADVPLPAPVNPVPGAVEAVVAKGAGFAVGANMMTAKVLYVLFDPQCPHCAHLWATTRPLGNRVRVVWMPVAFINAKSAPQGAAILAAADPVAAMNAHEARLNEGKGGMEPPASPDPALLAKVRQNTALWHELKGESVPMLVFKDPASGQSSTLEGALETDQLRKLLQL